jgi:hypothetical protein
MNGVKTFILSTAFVKRVLLYFMPSHFENLTTVKLLPYVLQITGFSGYDEVWIGEEIC